MFCFVLPSISGDHSNLLCSEDSSYVRVEEHAEFIAYYPNFTNIGLAFETMPNGSDGNGVFCCEAAFTGKLLKSFSHSNIAGNHVNNGVYYKGYSCPQNTGAFVYYNGLWVFAMGDYNKFLEEAAQNGGMGFGQAMIIYNGEKLKPWRTNSNIYRALCEKDNQLFIVESIKPVLYESFVNMLSDFGVVNAIYLDMGSGWNYAWYRDVDGRINYLHKKTHSYTTNWLVFY